jgi:type IV pilus assembly protein PilM
MSNIVGLDVGIGSIKAVSISKNKDKLFLDEIGEIKTPKIDWIKGDTKGQAIKDVAASIRNLLKDLKCKARQAVTFLPEDKIVSRLVILPPLKDNEIMDALKFEAETFVPYSLDEVTIDYELLEKDETGKSKIFVVAARNDLIEAYVKLFKAAGLELLALESIGVTMRRIAKLSTPDVTSMVVVDFGEKFSDIVGLYKSNISFTRSMPVGGESLTRAISIGLGLDMPSAEEYKKAYGMNEAQLEGKIRNAILPIFTSMAEEVRKALSLFAENNGRNVELLVLSGGGANLPGLAEEFTKLLGVEVQVIQPFVKMDTSNVSINFDLTTEGCRFTFATGLALRGLI